MRGRREIDRIPETRGSPESTGMTTQIPQPAPVTPSRNPLPIGVVAVVFTLFALAGCAGLAWS
jgi:hypothetical protein